MAKFIDSLLGLMLKVKQYSLQFVFLFLVWIIGFILFGINEGWSELWALFLISVGVRSPQHSGDFGNFFGLIWPILLEVIFFGFVIGELFEKFNPVVMSRIKAQHQRNHAIIIGYNNIGQRIIDHCIDNDCNFVIIEDDEEKLEDVVNAGHPAIIGDATEEINLKDARIKSAKEVFICVNKVNINIVLVDKIRKITKDVPIYVRSFEPHVREYLRENYVNTYPFSTSKWTMECLKGWTQGKKGKAIVIGKDTLAHTIAHHISTQNGRVVYLFDHTHDGTVFVENEKFHLVDKYACFLSDLKEVGNLKEIEQIFVCYNENQDFDESLYLASKLHARFPEIEVYVRIFDIELELLVKKYNAKTFSSSEVAFGKLQDLVQKHSVLKKN